MPKRRLATPHWGHQHWGTPIVGREAKSTGSTIFSRMSWTTCIWRRKQTGSCKPPPCHNCGRCCKCPPTTRGQSTTLSTQHACGVCKKQQRTTQHVQEDQPQDGGLLEYQPPRRRMPMLPSSHRTGPPQTSSPLTSVRTGFSRGQGSTP